MKYLLSLLIPCATAFTGLPVISRESASTKIVSLCMGGATGFATSTEGKRVRVKEVKELLDSSQMIFTVPGGSMTVPETQSLRRSLPEGTKMMTVKNTLMERALEGTDYEEACSLLKGANMWFFIEEDIGASVKAFNSFTKDTGKKESHPILGGVMEGEVYDTAGVDAVGKLPSRDDLFAMIAGAIKAVPTNVGRVVKAPSSKLARAIKLAGEKADE